MDHDKYMFVFASYLHYTQTDDLWQHMFFNGKCQYFCGRLLTISLTLIS